MAKIDDPLGQIKAGAQNPPKSPGAEIALRMTNWLPVIGGSIRKALDAIRGHDKDERLEFLMTAIIEQLEAHESSLDDVSRRLQQAEFTRLVSVTIERIFFGANERKIKRFAAVLTNAITIDKTEQHHEDAAAFIRALDELSEDDLRVLKHLYNHQGTLVNENHAMPYNSFFPAMKTMLADARNLGMQMDDFFSRCNRLTGYGLAIELSTKHATMGNPDDFAFRLTLLGKRLIQMLIAAGEVMKVTRR